uniref:Uncharacterized protein n=1 Tax=Sciurus vulgaris TaxID=55149 RepID=A0A8D2BET5_SCIVU
MFCVRPPELETKRNITKGGLVLFSANSNSSCMEHSKKIAENKSTDSRIREGERCFHHPDCLRRHCGREGGHMEPCFFLCICPQMSPHTSVNGKFPLRMVFSFFFP